MVGVAIFALIGLLGIVMDLGHLYVRKTELQNAADAAALAGVKQLNGQPAGIDAAVAEAIAMAGANASDFGQTAVSIAAAQISFSKVSPDGPWETAATAKADADVARYTFIKVDTNGIAQETRATWFMPLVGAASTSTANGKAVAGAPVCEGLPMFICPPPAGFVPGSTYFFADQPGAPVGPGNIGYFDPVSPGAPSLISGANDMRDIICAGKTYCIGAGTYSSLTQSAFGTMARALNTRFDDYGGLPASLTPERCRPDTNIMEYRYDNELKTPSSTAWMTPDPDHQSEQDAGALIGVHWSALRPPVLPGLPPVNGNYPSAASGGGTPYTQLSGSVFHTPPSSAHLTEAQAGRRILTFAIGAAAACDGSVNGSGKPVPITAYGKFLLSIKAVGTGSPKGIYVEYIETIPQLQASAPDIKLFR